MLRIRLSKVLFRDSIWALVYGWIVLLKFNEELNIPQSELKGTNELGISIRYERF